LRGPTPEKVRIRADGRTLLRLDQTRPERPPVVALTPAAERAVESAGAVLVADYGYGLAGSDLGALLARRTRQVPVVWDPHPRGSAPVADAALVTPNRTEAARFVPEVSGDGLAAWAERGRRLVRRWEAGAVSVTLGAEGALVVTGTGPPAVVPAPVTSDGDPCGAGDRFAVGAVLALQRGAGVVDAVGAAVAEASAFVAAGGAAASERPPAPATRADDVGETVERIRRQGGTIVATGGCFDLLHAGHVSMLQAARRLGDCLVVLLNSDDSIARLKGPDRPINEAEDRAAVLLGLACVDAIEVFDEDTPVAALERLRPDVFVKGGDYTGEEIPEARAMRAWGGQFLTVPYVAGRSTTRMIEEVLARVG
jgi:D-beta-D-heptose 7-phosphate kinase/D-beta-D-heptose 1-phosphate adenosyltransferase